MRKVWQRLALNTLRRSGEGGWEDNFFHRDLSGNVSFTLDLTACDFTAGGPALINFVDCTCASPLVSCA